MGPQLENGYTRIANEIIDALAAHKISGLGFQCVFVVLRQTYGWNKTEAPISIGHFCIATGRIDKAGKQDRKTITRTLQQLIDMNILIRKEPGTGAEKGRGNIATRYTAIYALNKHYQSWQGRGETATRGEKATSSKEVGAEMPLEVGAKSPTTRGEIATPLNTGLKTIKDNIPYNPLDQDQSPPISNAQSLDQSQPHDIDSNLPLDLQCYTAVQKTYIELCDKNSNWQPLRTFNLTGTHKRTIKAAMTDDPARRSPQWWIDYLKECTEYPFLRGESEDAKINIGLSFLIKAETIQKVEDGIYKKQPKYQGYVPASSPKPPKPEDTLPEGEEPATPEQMKELFKQLGEISASKGID